MTSVKFRQFCEANGWFDRWGRFNADRREPTLDPQSNNNLLYHAEYLAVLDLYGEIEERDGHTLEAMFRLHQVEPGLLKRDPDSGMPQKHDDVLGSACAAALVGRYDLAKEILEYLRANDWEIDVLDPNGNYDVALDISRIGGVEFVISRCAGESLGLWSQAILGITMVAAAYKHQNPKGGDSGALMDWLSFRALKKVNKDKGGGFVLNFFLAWYERIMKKDPLAIGSRFARYFPINGKMHPIALYTWGKI